MSKQKRKMKIYQEEAKTRLTSHWDLDYMSTQELDALLKAGPEQGQVSPANQAGIGERSRLPQIFLGLILAAFLAAAFYVI